MSKGYLPKKVAYVCAKPETEDVYDDEENCKGKIASYKVIPTYPVQDGKSLDAAIKWTGLEKPKIDVLDNVPVQSVRVINLEERGNGGRAYKVLVNEKYYVDMREDVVLDTMINFGVDKGAILKGQYVWGKYGSNMKLLRVGSSQHKEFSKGVDVSELPTIEPKDLIVGGVYETKKGEIEIYLGGFQTYQFKGTEKYYGYFSSGPRNIDMRLMKKRVYASIEYRAWHHKKKVDFAKCDPNILFVDESKNSKNPPEPIGTYYIFLRSAKAKYIKKIAQLDMSNVDIITKIRYSGINDRNDNPYPWCCYWEHTCIGNEAEVHPSLEIFNLPIEK